MGLSLFCFARMYSGFSGFSVQGLRSGRLFMQAVPEPAQFLEFG